MRRRFSLFRSTRRVDPIRQFSHRVSRGRRGKKLLLVISGTSSGADTLAAFTVPPREGDPRL